ncbi:uncharacterized protein UTRI_05484 [Ustilago trichophora]|uniref:Transmembrane protein n=1 Tax=Ustilago trichophora TaxID=86804 RepID=A0A5C3EGY5_9BASI|nr:uncharacterized protein UTRI_05484 [Ustilago trichophora]
MSTTISNSTNTTLPIANVAANSSNIAVTNMVSNVTAPSNTTSNGQDTLLKNDDAMVTLLTFGPLSSCISLPNLAASSLPSTANYSSTAQQQIIQSWLTSLPTTSSCTTLSWTLKPDYSHHLNSMAIFQSQLEQLFPTSNSTAGSSKTLEAAQPGTSAAGIKNANASANGSVAAASTPSVASFFPGGTAPSAISGLASSNATLPTGLPLWIGVVIASSALVHLLSFIIHICSDLDALFPSLAIKLQGKPDEPSLPSHALPSNESSATLVDATPPSDPDVKVADPPSYTEPVTTQGLSTQNGLKPTPALIRFSRKAKRLMVPLLLLSALGTIAVAVVLNSKFAAGPVRNFPSSLSSVVAPVALPDANFTLSQMPSSSASLVNTTTSASMTGNSSSGSISRPSTVPTFGVNATSDKLPDNERHSLTDVNAPAATPTTTPSPIITTTTTQSMTKLVRRQTNFFPTPTSTDTTPASATRPTTIASFSSPSNSLPPASPFASTASTPNASLFPPNPTSTTTPAGSASTLTQAMPTNSTIESLTPTDPLFVISSGDSIHRLWWIVMLNFLLWFAQRRRTRSQIGTDKARLAILAQLSVHHKQQQQQQQQ